MKNRNEITEIIQFISAFKLPDSENDIEYCIDQMTTDVDEEFLKNRAADII